MLKTKIGMDDEQRIKKLRYRDLKPRSVVYDPGIIKEINHRAEAMVDKLISWGKLEEYLEHVCGYRYAQHLQGFEYTKEYNFGFEQVEFPIKYEKYIDETALLVLTAAAERFEYYKKDKRPYIFFMKDPGYDIAYLLNQYVSCYYVYSFTVHNTTYFSVVTYDTEFYNLRLKKQQAHLIKQVKIPQDKDLNKAILFVSGSFDRNTYKLDSYTEPGYDNRSLNYVRDFVTFRDPLEEDKKLWLKNKARLDKALDISKKNNGNIPISEIVNQYSYKNFYIRACSLYA